MLCYDCRCLFNVTYGYTIVIAVTVKYIYYYELYIALYHNIINRLNKIMSLVDQETKNTMY